MSGFPDHVAQSGEMNEAAPLAVELDKVIDPVLEGKNAQVVVIGHREDGAGFTLSYGVGPHMLVGLLSIALQQAVEQIGGRMQVVHAQAPPPVPEDLL